MTKLRDGYFRQISSKVGDDNYLLKAAGGYIGLHTGRNNEANKVVRTDDYGYIQAGWINTTSGSMDGSTPTRIYASYDGYIRYMTPAYFFSNLSNDSNQLSVTVGGQNRKLTVAYASSAEVANYLDGYTKIVTVNGDINTYYPVKIPHTGRKSLINTISVWRNLGGLKSAIYPGSHGSFTTGNGGGVSCWYEFVGRYNGWDGNGGYYYTRHAWYGYDRQLSHAAAPGSAVGDLFVWLRGGGTEYYVSTNYPFSDPVVYYERTNASGNSTYPSWVEPRTDIGNEGILTNIYYGNITGNANTASGLSVTHYWANVAISKNQDLTTTPTFGKVYISGAYPHIDMTSTSAESSIYFRPSSGTSWAIGKAPWGVGGFGIGILSDGSKLTILDNGNVGIGTTSPGHKLVVNGNFSSSNYQIYGSASGTNCNSATYTGIWYYSSNGPATQQGTGSTDGSLWTQAYSDSWVSQTAQDYRTGTLFTRSRNNGTWTRWRTIAPADSDFEMAPIANIVYNPYGRKFTKFAGTNGSWDTHAYSTVGYKECRLTYKIGQTNAYIMVGLNSDPTYNASYDSIDYCWYTQNGGGLCFYENGSSVSSISGHTTYTTGDELIVEYSEGYVRYYHNGVLCREIARSYGTPLYFDSSFYHYGYIYDVVFEPIRGAMRVDLMSKVTNWNTVTTSIFKSSENSTTNAPTTGFIYGTTLRFHRGWTTYYTDLVVDLYNDKMFFRRAADGSFGSWRELLHSGNYTSWVYAKSDVYTKTESDNRFVNVTGDTMSASLNFNNGGNWISSINTTRDGLGSGSMGGIDGSGMYFSQTMSGGSMSYMYLKGGVGLNVYDNIWSKKNITAEGSIAVTKSSGDHSYGLSLYAGVNYITNWGITAGLTGTGGTYGDVSSDWAVYFHCAGTNTRGFIFTNGLGTNKASISARGYITGERIIRRDSSDSYVLLGGGGHKLESSLSVSSAAQLTTGRYLWGRYFDGTSDITGKAQFASKYFYNTQPSLGALNDGTIEFRASTSSGALCNYGLFIYDDYWSGLASLQSGYTNGSTNALPIALQPLGGNVGIGMGTSLPSEKLEIWGNLRICNPSDSQTLAKFLNFSNSPYGLILKSYSNGAFHLQSQRESDNSETFSLLLNPNGGNVGIGFTSPSTKLDIQGIDKVSMSMDTSNDYRFSPSFKGQLHLNHASHGSGSGINDGYIDGITFGVGSSAYAGIFVQNSGAYGSRIIFTTTNDYTYNKARVIIHHDGRTWFNKRVDASGFYHNSYGSSAWVNTTDGGAAKIADMSVAYATSAGNASNVTVNDSNANSTYRIVWHSGSTLYSTNNIYCNPYSDYLYASGIYSLGSLGCTQTSGDHSYGLSLYGAPSNVTNWGITAGLTGSGGTYGDVSSDWAVYFHCAGTNTRGFIFTNGLGTNKASISSRGYITGERIIRRDSSDSYVLLGGGGHYSLNNILHGNSYGTMEGVISDCNSVSVTGIYSHSGFSNRPDGVGNWGTLFNLRLYNSNNSYHRQLFFDCYGTDKIWTRSDNGGSWTSWKELITSANIGSQSVNYANSAGYATSAGSATDSTKVAKAGDTMTGRLELSVGDKKLSSSSPIGTGKGDIHLYTTNYGSGGSITDGNVASITFGTGTSANSQAGIYVVTSGSYGTQMIFGTTNSYATGVRYNTIIDSNGYLTSPAGFIKSGYNNNYVLLAGGGHALLSSIGGSPDYTIWRDNSNSTDYKIQVVSSLPSSPNSNTFYVIV